MFEYFDDGKCRPNNTALRASLNSALSKAHLLRKIEEGTSVTEIPSKQIQNFVHISIELVRKKIDDKCGCYIHAHFVPKM